VFIVLSFLVLLSPLYFAILLTSGLSRPTKVLLAAVSLFLLITVPLVLILLGAS
jgi:hypothetical protein